MESGIQSSFIPHDAGVQTPVPRVSRGGGLSDLLFLASIVMLVASLALGGAVFLYSEYLDTTADSKVEQLQRAQEAFEPALIQELTRLDDRMRAAEQVLNTHVAPTAFFNTLAESTLATVAFQSLDMQASDAQKITVKMSGVAASVNSIALQADLYSKNGVITNPIFSSINRQADGVHFNLSALVNPAAIGYSQNLSAVRTQAVPETPASPFDAVPTGAATNTPQQ